jgi:cellulose synthase/poly-beta-1,6-N-acetylglucosamine synthase-like glycosyltransferase
MCAELLTVSAAHISSPDAPAHSSHDLPRPPAGEINGKSNNLNNCLHLLYPKGITIPNSEVLVVLDADMVPTQNFFTKILEVMQDDNVALCLTPQGYHNVRPDGDIFNNVNLGFWEYILPGYDAFGYIACTGTNFALRANALAHCGWFPTYTITEDYALGMELKRLGYNAVYLKEYLAYGEAPEDMRNVFRQRSRWCKGQMQVRSQSDRM